VGFSFGGASGGGQPLFACWGFSDKCDLWTDSIIYFYYFTALSR